MKKPTLNSTQHRRKIRKLAELSLIAPILGLVFFLTPLLDSFTQSAGSNSVGKALAYIFGLWAGLIVIANIISRLLAREFSKE